MLSVNINLLLSLFVFLFFFFLLFFFFFFQAEDGIRDPLVTGVQTCALPIRPTRTSGHTTKEVERSTSACGVLSSPAGVCGSKAAWRGPPAMRSAICSTSPHARRSPSTPARKDGRRSPNGRACPCARCWRQPAYGRALAS